MKVVVFGNVTLDVLCSPVNDVPRDQSIAFERSLISPGGCGSNVAVGLRALNIPVALVAWTGQDEASTLLDQFWNRWGIDCQYVMRAHDLDTAVSVGLIDSQAQPRFIHTPGANRLLTVDQMLPDEFYLKGARYLHVAGFFVLPGLLDGRLSDALERAHNAGLVTSLDVVHSPKMDQPEILWPCLQHLDYFLCNEQEAWRITGMKDAIHAAANLRKRGAANVIIKLGSRGCYVDNSSWQGVIPGFHVDVVDTAGAGDAFAAGLLAGLVQGMSVTSACRLANKAGAHVVGTLGTVTGWEKPFGEAADVR